MVYLKIGEILYPATLRERTRDTEWNDRNTMAVTLEATYQEAVDIFQDGMTWGHVYQGPDYIDEEGNTITPDPVEYDDSEFEVLGDIMVHQDGTVTVKMGKVIAAELLETLEEALSV